MTSKLIAIAAVAAIAGVLLAAPATQAAVLYSNGPINGTIDAWYISNGYAVTDSFTLFSAATVTGVDFGEWTSGGVPSTVGWSITTDAFSVTTLASGTASLSSVYLHNAFGYAVYETSFSIPGLSLAAGTYWLELADASSHGFWDENDGPSLAFENTTSEPIRSESFDIVGTAGQAAPEPASLLLLGSSLVALASMWRRKHA
jgi:hypothetical protein